MASRPQLDFGLTSMLLAPLAVAVLLLGCGGTQFASNNGKKGGVTTPSQNTQPTTLSTKIRVGCDGDKATAAADQAITGGDGTTVTLTGDFCGQPQASTSAALTVLFIFDASGSMQTNDPVTNGSCGRLQAAQTILDKLAAAPEAGQAQLSLAMQAFGTQAMPGIAPTNLTTFKTQLTAASACRSDGNTTNYEAAFTAASNLLASIQGHKAVYFISDGLPTAAGTTTTTNGGLLGAINSLVNTSNLQSAQTIYNAGSAAAAKLRALDHLVLNVVFLGTGSSSAEATAPAGLPEPKTYLTDIAGGADRLRVVATAQDLATQIGTFATPTAAGNLGSDAFKATLTAPGLGTKDVELVDLTQDPAEPNLWHFTTTPIALFGTFGQTVANTLLVDIKGQDGKHYTGTATIQFTLK